MLIRIERCKTCVSRIGSATLVFQHAAISTSETNGVAAPSGDVSAGGPPQVARRHAYLRIAASVHDYPALRFAHPGERRQTARKKRHQARPCLRGRATAVGRRPEAVCQPD